MTDSVVYAGGASNSPREFIKTWQESSSVAEVARKLDCTGNAVRVRAYRYRLRGIPFKEFPPVEIELPDWPALARYAEELVPADQGKTST